MDDLERALAKMLADPMTLAMMAADRVNPAELRAAWTVAAGRRVLPPPAAGQPACSGRDDLPW